MKNTKFISYSQQTYANIMGDCHYWNKIYFRDLCRNKPRINAEYLRIE